MAAETDKQDKEIRDISLGKRIYKGVRMYQNEIEDIQTMNIKDDDVFVCSFPRSGTTLLQEMVYLIMTLDFETAKKSNIDTRFPVIDVYIPEIPFYQGIKMVKEMKSPRMAMSHLHHFLLPEQLQQGKGRIIYTVRNPKDVVTSLCKLRHWMNEIDENSYESFIEEFINGTGQACPWTKHVLEFWGKKDERKLLFLQYEVFSRDRPAAIRRIAEFLERNLSDEDVERISDHCSLENMRNNEMVNYLYLEKYKKTNKDAPERFINAGTLGGWRDFLTEDQGKRIDKMIDELEAAGLFITRT